MKNNILNNIENYNSKIEQNECVLFLKYIGLLHELIENATDHIFIQKETKGQLIDKLVEMKNKDLLASDLSQIFLKNMSRIETNTPMWNPLFLGLRPILNNMLSLFLKAHNHQPPTHPSSPQYLYHSNHLTDRVLSRRSCVIPYKWVV